MLLLCKIEAIESRGLYYCYSFSRHNSWKNNRHSQESCKEFNPEMVVFEDYPREFSKMFWPSFNFLFRVNMKFWFQDERWLTRYWRFFNLLILIFPQNIILWHTFCFFSVILSLYVCAQFFFKFIWEYSHQNICSWYLLT